MPGSAIQFGETVLQLSRNSVYTIHQNRGDISLNYAPTTETGSGYGALKGSQIGPSSHKSKGSCLKEPLGPESPLQAFCNGKYWTEIPQGESRCTVDGEGNGFIQKKNERGDWVNVDDGSSTLAANEESQDGRNKGRSQSLSNLSKAVSDLTVGE